MKKLLPLTIAIMVFSHSAYALFCPNNFNQINLGDSIDQVTQECGKPDIQDTKDTSASGPQQWIYYIKPDPTRPKANTLQVTIAFDASGKASNVGVNGTSLVTSKICNGNSVHLGDTTDQVKAACGAPAIVNTSGGSTSVPPTTISTFTYQTNPPTILTFTNGKLTSRK